MKKYKVKKDWYIWFAWEGYTEKGGDINIPVGLREDTDTRYFLSEKPGVGVNLVMIKASPT
ncbi:MAG: hypothetical protein NZ901_02945 [Geminocystis sp.]|nr:hypothetical protein [Geminocystis sp.]HIK37214.1 hypothetical protein [Geminocystis sp. M7585_C2015_104]MCS7147129.1 hypothetical protein [Geminocystis sp.]MCX8079122.1 hypothetical protein [Geminocystis sp.]MDW8116765.1 hypothetical protein [Geminocystis sp.]